MADLNAIFCDFLRAEEGAVTVDWVVLTAALVGLGLAVMTVVSGGVQTVSADTDATLRGVQIQTSFFRAGTIFDSDFSGGLGDWSGGSVANLNGFGDVLQLGSGEYAELTLDVPQGASTATISFDMIGGDDLDGEPATIFINGEAVAVYQDDHGNISLGDNGVDGISVSVNQLYTNDAEGAGNHGHDSRAQYTITVENPTDSLSFGVESGANQGVNNEFYAIDDVSISTS
jgi:hypothetical protein